MGLVTKPLGFGDGQNALIDLRRERDRVGGTIEVSADGWTSSCLSTEPDPESPDPGGARSSATAAGSGSCRPAKSDLSGGQLIDRFGSDAEFWAEGDVLPLP